MKYTIGILRGDGDIDVIATFNGENAACESEEHARQNVELLRRELIYQTGFADIHVFERDDVPDVITFDDGIVAQPNNSFNTRPE